MVTYTNGHFSSLKELVKQITDNVSLIQSDELTFP